MINMYLVSHTVIEVNLCHAPGDPISPVIAMNEDLLQLVSCYSLIGNRNFNSTITGVLLYLEQIVHDDYDDDTDFNLERNKQCMLNQDKFSQGKAITAHTV